MKNRNRMTSSIRRALFACALALAAGSGLASLSAEEVGYRLRATAMPSTTSTTQNWWCEGKCPAGEDGVKCCNIRSNSTGDEETSSEGTTSN